MTDPKQNQHWEALAQELGAAIPARVTEMGKRLLKGYKPRYCHALTNVSVTVYKGDIIGIIGPNGSGKSTFLRTVSGIYHPDAGSVHTHGRISTLLSLGTGFDNNLSGLDNICLNGLIIGMSQAAINANIPQIIEFAEIGDFIHVPMKYYSSGMISRLSFAIVLAMEPDILLIDEIFSVGDLAFQKKSEKAMHNLLSRSNCQMIVTHNLALVREHCNRALYFEGGRIKMDGPPDAVVSRYERNYGLANANS